MPHGDAAVPTPDAAAQPTKPPPMPNCWRCQCAELPNGAAGSAEPPAVPKVPNYAAPVPGAPAVAPERSGTSAPSGNCLDLLSGEVPLPVLRDWLIAHPNASAIRDAAWRELIRRGRQGKPGWVIAAVGVAMPTLAAMAGTLAGGDRRRPR
jgi:hypothetical protein